MWSTAFIVSTCILLLKGDSDIESDSVVQLLQEYVQINTTSTSDLTFLSCVNGINFDNMNSFDYYGLVKVMSRARNTNIAGFVLGLLVYDLKESWFYYFTLGSVTSFNYLIAPAVEFWKNLAEEEGLPFSVFELTSGYPIVVIKWAGSNSSLSSIMLNSHMDVVPADEEDGWTYPPFSGHIEDGVIYGRGTQDMKSVSIQYYEALRRLKADNVTLLRDVYMTLMPDEELGAESGMIPFLESEEFAELNVGIELDEGTSYPLPIIPVFYQDKVVWQIEVTCRGEAGHGSTFPATNASATGKCTNVINQMVEIRDVEYAKSIEATIFNAGAYTSINLNKMNGGTANNIIPGSVSLTFDIRLGTSVNEDTLEAQLNEIIAAAGDNITMSFIIKNQQSPATVITDDNPYWTAFSLGASNANISILPIVPPGSTDARHVRNAGYPAFGFSPMPNTPLLLHSVNERLDLEVFLQGIPIYASIIKELASIPAESVAEDASTYLLYTAV